MKISKLNSAFITSHKNMDKFMRECVNESSNAVLLETFDDKCILADHKNGNLYQANYSFDGKVLTFENFEQIDLEKDSSNLNEAVGKYFDDEEVDIVEAYENASNSGKDMVEESLTEALASKNMAATIDYSELLGINEEIEDLKNTKLYQIYEERLNDKPTDSIKYFDWNNTVKVALVDEDEANIISTTDMAKGKSLKSNVEFKSEFKDAIAEAVEGNKDLLESVLESNRSIATLDKADLKALVGFSVIGNTKLMSNRNTITEMVDEMINEDPMLSAIRESAEGANEEETPKEAACSGSDCEELLKALKKASDKVTDEKLSTKINSLIDAIETSKEADTTDVGAVKESIELLRM